MYMYTNMYSAHPDLTYMYIQYTTKECTLVTHGARALRQLCRRRPTSCDRRKVTQPVVSLLAPPLMSHIAPLLVRHCDRAHTGAHPIKIILRLALVRICATLVPICAVNRRAVVHVNV